MAWHVIYDMNIFQLPLLAQIQEMWTLRPDHHDKGPSSVAQQSVTSVSLATD